jgi:hypothetical protein
LPGRLAHTFAQEFPKPCLDLILLGVMGADVRGEIWDLFFRVTKGIKSRVVFDAKVGGISRGMVETNGRLELKYLAGGIEIDKSYAVSEDVVYPPDIDWFGRHFKLAVQQTLVKAVTRPKHQLVRAKSHRLPIPVCCRVVYGENSHQLPDFQDHSMLRLYGTRDPGLPGEYTATAAIFSMLTAAWLGTFLKSSASLESDEEFNFEDSGRLRHHVQLHSAGSYAADAERSLFSAVRSFM